jgi:hypothetical protein
MTEGATLSVFFVRQASAPAVTVPELVPLELLVVVPPELPPVELLEVTLPELVAEVPEVEPLEFDAVDPLEDVASPPVDDAPLEDELPEVDPFPWPVGNPPSEPTQPSAARSASAHAHEPETFTVMTAPPNVVALFEGTGLRKRKESLRMVGGCHTSPKRVSEGDCHVRRPKRL